MRERRVTLSVDMPLGVINFKAMRDAIQERVSEYAELGMVEEALTLNRILNLVDFGIHQVETTADHIPLAALRDKP
jgi:hypothetical protein